MRVIGSQVDAQWVSDVMFKEQHDQQKRDRKEPPGDGPPLGHDRPNRSRQQKKEQCWNHWWQYDLDAANDQVE
jgi:hypothetical protein